MPYAILVNEPKTEFDYQALDYCKLFGGSIEKKAFNEDAKKYLGDVETFQLENVVDSYILAFRDLTIGEMKSIDISNMVYYFTNGKINPSIQLIHGAIDAFIAFGSRSAYLIANRLKHADINRAVYRAIPWVNVEGIKQYESPPLGKISGAGDLDLRSMFRLMSSGAIVVVPDRSPFNEFIIDRWNGIIHRGDINKMSEKDFVDIKSTLSLDKAEQIATRAREMSAIILDKQGNITKFEHDVINRNGFDHNEPWIKIDIKKGTKWIVQKESMEGGVVERIPDSVNKPYNPMRLSTLHQLIDYLVPIKFEEVYVFDIMNEKIEEDTETNILRSLALMGDRVRNIFFCMEAPDDWKNITPHLTFLSQSEGVKRVS